MFNKLEPNEMFSLGDAAFDKRYGERRRIHIYPDPKVPDAVVIHIWLEDHTLGNILRMELLRNKEVLFCGYKVPHPLNHMIEFRLQTVPTTTPELAIKHAIKNLRGECRDMLEQFDKGVAELRKKMDDDDLDRPGDLQEPLLISHNEPFTEGDKVRTGDPSFGDAMSRTDGPPSSPQDEGLSTSGSEALPRRSDAESGVEDELRMPPEDVVSRQMDMEDKLRNLEEMAKLGETTKRDGDSSDPGYSPTSAHSGEAPTVDREEHGPADADASGAAPMDIDN